MQHREFKGRVRSRIYASDAQPRIQFIPSVRAFPALTTHLAGMAALRPFPESSFSSSAFLSSVFDEIRGRFLYRATTILRRGEHIYDMGYEEEGG